MKLLLKINSEKTRKRHSQSRTNGWWNSSLNSQTITTMTTTPITTTASVTTTTTSSTASSAKMNAMPSVVRSINTSRLHSRNTTVTQSLTTTSKLLLIILLIVCVAVGVVVYLEITKVSEASQNAPILFGNNYEHGTFPNLGNGHLIVDRNQWGASELAKALTVPLKHPIPYVLITHIGVQSKPCENIYKCSIKMRTIQDSAIAEKNLPDIQSNFYVADDGNIYVGRGWDWANTYANKTLAITFMGDYGRYVPSDKQLEASQFLLAYGLTNQNIQLDYKLVAQNQTKDTKSPGANVYKQIVKWPHFYPCGMNNNPACGSELGLPAVWNGNM